MRTGFSKLIIFCIFPVLSAGCAGEEPDGAPTADQVRKEVQEAVETSAGFAQTKAKAYGTRLRAELAAIDARIDSLRQKAEEKGLLKIERDRETLEALQRQRDLAAERLQEFRSQSGAKLRELRDDLDSTMADLKGSLQKAAERFRD